MSNIVYRLIVDAKNAIKGTDQTVEGLKRTSDEAKRAEKATQGAGKATQEMGKVSASSMTELAGKFEAMGVPLGGYGRGLQAATKITQTATASTKMLRMALIALPFIAIATAVMTLFKAFTSTQEGADRLNRILVPLRAMMDRLWGMAQDLSIAIVDAFKNPQDAVKALWEVIKSQIINRLTGVVDMFGALGRTIKAALTLDFDTMKQEAAEFGNAYLQVMTGVEDVTGKIRDGWKGISDEMKQAIENGKRIQELEELIGNLKTAQAVPMAKLNREYQELRTIANDTSVTEAERLAMADEAIEKRRQIKDMELELLDLQIEQLQLQQSQNDTSREEQLQLQQLIARRDEVAASAERDLRNIVRGRNRVLDMIKQQEQAEVLAAEKVAAVEAEKHRMYLSGLEDRAERFREMTLSEDEIRQEQYDKRLSELYELEQQEIITIQEAADIKNAIWDEMYGAEIEAKRAAEEEKARIDQEARDADKQREQDLQKARIDAQARAIGEAIAQDIARADSAKEAAGLIMQSLLNEILLRAFNSVFKAVPFPFNAIVAPVAAVAARQSAKALIPGFAQGGVVSGGVGIKRNNGDDRLITARTGEVILNSQQQQRIGRGTLAAAGVPGISGGDNMSDAIRSLKNDIARMKFQIDLVEATDKISDQQQTNSKRRIIAV